MKKILHFHPNAFYAKNFVKPLINVEIKSGYSSKLISEKSNGTSNYVLKFSLSLNPLILFFNFIKLILFFVKNKPDIIFAHNSTSAFLPLLVSRIFFVRHIIYFNHGLPYLGYKGFLNYSLLSLEKVNCALSKLVITVSRDMQEKINSFAKKKVFIIHNGSASGLDIKKKKLNIKSIKNIKKRIDFNVNDIIILFVGRPNKRKGFFDILKLWKEKFNNRTNFKLILLGIYPEDVMKITKNMPNNIFPMGFVNDIENFFELADYLFMTSHHEGLSYSVLEAFKQKTIVISNKIDGVSELIIHGHNGFLVDKNRINDFLKFLKKCEKNKKLKEDFFNRSIKIIKNYNRVNFLKSYLSFLKTLN